MQSSVSVEVLKRVADIIEENQKDLDGEEDNYVTNIARQTPYCRKTIEKAFNALEEELRIAESFRLGRRRCLRLTVNRA